MVNAFLETDICAFLALAEEEGWLCDRWELKFLLQNFPQGCFVRREAGAGIGFVTSANYGSTGWIGNLLVHPDGRRRGIGSGLMDLAMTALIESGVETIWLTASDQGVGIYRRLGFLPIDHVHRWTGRGGGNGSIQPAPVDVELVTRVDGGGWGARREGLIRATCENGRFDTSSDAFICSQPWGGGTKIGPWGCLAQNQAGPLLDRALPHAGEQVFLDVPASNYAAADLLRAKGFSVGGTTVLMYRGAQPDYCPDKVFALASMGSMG